MTHTGSSNIIAKGRFSPSFLCRFLIMMCLAARSMQAQQQPEQKVVPGDDEVWEHGDMDDLHIYLNCDDYPGVNNHSNENWKLLQSTYESIVKDQSSLPPGGFLGLDGFYVPYKIIEHEDGGLGIITTKPIPKGTLVWKSIRTAKFQFVKDYRQFLRQLPPALTCDVMKWAYTRWEQQNMVACIDLDPGSLIKECNIHDEDDKDHKKDDDCTLEVNSPRGSGCNLQFVAKRDIAAGEEFRMDYSFCEMDVGWTMFGMWREEAESDDEDTEGDGDDDDHEGDDDEDDDEEDEEEDDLPRADEEL